LTQMYISRIRYRCWHHCCVCVRYSTAAVDKEVRSTSLYHCRQCCIVLNSRSDRMDHTVVCFTTHDCSRKLQKQYQCTNSFRATADHD